MMVSNNIVMENVHIWGRNFSGIEKKFNPAGKRNFCVTLDEQNAMNLKNEGWNIKTIQPNDQYDQPMYYQQVNLNYGRIKPLVVLISSAGKQELDENTVGLLDTAELANVDLVIRPYNWEVNNQTGVKAYVKSIYVTLAEDELAAKYRDSYDE